MSRQMKNVAVADVLENATYAADSVEMMHREDDKHVVIMRTREHDTELSIWLDPLDGAALVVGRPAVGAPFTIMLDPNTPTHVLTALINHA